MAADQKRSNFKFARNRYASSAFRLFDRREGREFDLVPAAAAAMKRVFGSGGMQDVLGWRASSVSSRLRRPS